MIHQPLRPKELIDERYDVALWTASPAGRAFFDFFIKDQQTKGRVPSVNHGQALAMNQAYVMMRASSYFVTPEMTAVIEHASRTLPMHPLRRTDAPADFGFMYLPEPVVVIDMNAVTQYVSLITWGPIYRTADGSMVLPNEDFVARPGLYGAESNFADTATGFFFAFYSDASDPRDSLHGVWQRLQNEPEKRSRWHRFTMYHYQPMSFGLDYTDIESWAFEPPYEPGGEHLTDAERAQHDFERTKLFRWLFTSWVMMQQRINMPSTMIADRPQRRRWKRHDIDPEPVTVVALRKYDRPNRPDSEDVNEVNWSHRWLVDGHWMHLKADRYKEERWVWRSPHVKGPADKPLVVKDRVFNLRR